MKYLLPVLLILFSGIGCDQRTGQSTDVTKNTDSLTTEIPKSTPAAAPPAEEKPASVKERAREVLQVLKNNDLAGLAEFAHPEQGILFSPYATIEPDQDVTLMAEEIRNLANSDSTIRWGFQDGSGKPIEMTLDEYLDEYIYDSPFLESDSVSENQVKQYGNSINNLREVFPEAEVVEYFLPGQEEKYGGMDWKALRLVFRPYRRQLYLVGIIHSQWTI